MVGICGSGESKQLELVICNLREQNKRIVSEYDQYHTCVVFCAQVSGNRIVIPSTKSLIGKTFTEDLDENTVDKLPAEADEKMR